MNHVCAKRQPCVQSSEGISTVSRRMAEQVAFTTDNEHNEYDASSEHEGEREDEEERGDGEERENEGERVEEREKEKGRCAEEYGEAEEEIRAAFARMHMTRPSKALNHYLTTLKDGSRTWNEETLIMGIHDFAAIIGCQRPKYFETPWSGLRYPAEIEELWCQTYPHLSRVAMEENFGWVCPQTWSYTFEDNTCTLTYCGSAPLSQGFNEAVIGPTSVDCGMVCQFLVGMGIRYMIGDKLFNRAFDVPGRQFRIVQSWNKSGRGGNPFYAFYDRFSSTSTRIHTLTFYNHSSYMEKHPGGRHRLENTTQVDDEYLMFHPSSTYKSLSLDEVQQKLVESYNEARDLADAKAMALWKLYPDYVHPNFAPHTWGEMHKKSCKMAADNIIDVEELRRDQRSEIRLLFNFQRLKSCLERASRSPTAVDILGGAEEAHAKRLRRDAKRILIPDCNDVIARLKETDNLLKSLERRINTEEEGTIEQGSNVKGPLKRELDDILSELAVQLRSARELYARRLQKQLRVLEQVNITLADFDNTLKPLQTGEQSGDEESAKEL